LSSQQDVRWRGGDRRSWSSGPIWTKLARPYLRNKIQKYKGLRGMAQEVAYMHEALGSIPNTANEKMMDNQMEMSRRSLRS
jgi:hypothetical protein